jgi:hypothetical protein
VCQAVGEAFELGRIEKKNIAEPIRAILAN